MLKRAARQRTLGRLIFLSVLGHLGLLFLLGRAGSFDFTPPIASGKSIEVELQQGDHRPVKEGNGRALGRGRRRVLPREELSESHTAGTGSQTADSTLPPDPAVKDAEQQPAHPAVTDRLAAAPAEEKKPAEGEGQPAKPSAEVASAMKPPEPPAAAVTGPEAKAGRKLKMPPPLRSGAEFVSATSERLTYRVTLRGLPIGEAELAAVNAGGKMKITATLRSSPLVEAFCLVDDRVESELVAGNYLVTTVRQHEGDYYRNSGFTIMMREKKAFSTDRLQGRFVTDTLPSSDVTDPITGLYFLRNQPLYQGASMQLHLYDSGTYRAASVEVLRQERIRMTGLGEVKTLVIRPHLESSPLFRRMDDLLIWLTDDRFKVPVRAKARVSLGEVTAELVSSVIDRDDAAGQEAQRRRHSP